MLKQKTTYYSDYCLTIHGSSTQTIVYLYAGIKCIYISIYHSNIKINCLSLILIPVKVVFFLNTYIYIIHITNKNMIFKNVSYAFNMPSGCVS